MLEQNELGPVGKQGNDKGQCLEDLEWMKNKSWKEKNEDYRSRKCQG